MPLRFGLLSRLCSWMPPPVQVPLRASPDLTGNVQHFNFCYHFMETATTNLSLERTPLDRIEVKPWPTEMPLRVLGILFGIGFWLLIAVLAVAVLLGAHAAGLSIVLVYAAIIVFAVLVMQVAFITHLRGNSVRLGPQQFPDLYARVRRLAGRIGLRRMPEVYLMQAGGALNALATRFLRANMVVLYSDLLEACEDDAAAQDMIIAHELGHLHAGHLRLRWLLLPFLISPIWGKWLSRSREYTCDRYGLAAAGNKESAMRGLTILAAGGRYGKAVNVQAFVDQRRSLNTGWMTIGQWLSTHPPLVKRMAAIDPSLEGGQPFTTSGVLRALGIYGGLAGVVALCVGLVTLSSKLPGFGGDVFKDLLQLGNTGGFSSGAGPAGAEEDQADGDEYAIPETAAEDLQSAFEVVGDFLDAEVAAGRELPADHEELEARWAGSRGGEDLPIDPYDGDVLGYELTDDGYCLWSSGPDGEPETDDDPTYEGP